MPEAYIIDAVRTPVGRRGKGLAGVHPLDLAAAPLRELVARQNIDSAEYDEVRRPAHDGLRGVVDRLLAGAALAFDRGAGDVLGEPGREPGVARHVHGLRAELVDAAEDDLVVFG